MTALFTPWRPAPVRTARLRQAFLARAVAGELGASFFSLGLNDVLDMWLGESERRLHDAFEAARRAAPCVLFLDELDGAQADNEGVFVLAERPVAELDVARLAKRTDGCSGADLVRIVEAASEAALQESVRTGELRPIGQRRLEAAAAGTPPSTRAWFSVAHNYAIYANEGGQYDDLLAHIRTHRLL